MSNSENLISLLCLMDQEPKLTVKKMVANMGTTGKTVCHFLKCLKESHSIYKKGDSCFSFHHYKIESIKFTGYEFIALVNTCSSHLKQKGLLFFLDLVSAVKTIKFTTFLREKIINTIEESIKENFTINIAYSFHSSEISCNYSQYRYQVLWHSENLYMVADCHRREEVRSFPLESLISVDKTGKKSAGTEALV